MRFTPIPKQTFTPDGKGLCRWCIGPLSGRRRTFCSDECVHEARIRSDGSYIRDCLKKRDKGVCIDCGFDTERFRLDLNYMAKIRAQGVLAFARTQSKVLERFPGIRIDQFIYIVSEEAYAKRVARGIIPGDPYRVAEPEEVLPLRLHNRIKRLAGARLARLTAEFTARGFKEFFSGHRTSMYDADHIIPVEHGGSNDLSNIATRCLECHKNKSKQYATKRAKRKREEVVSRVQPSPLIGRL